MAEAVNTSSTYTVHLCIFKPCTQSAPCNLLLLPMRTTMPVFSEATLELYFSNGLQRVNLEIELMRKTNHKKIKTFRCPLFIIIK